MGTNLASDPRPRRIAFVSDSVYPFFKGGKERRLWEITRRLAAAGIDVRVYTMQWWPGGRTLTLDGVRLEAITRYHSVYHHERRSVTEAIRFGLATLKLLWARFDVLDVDHMPYFPLFAARLVCLVRGKPLVATWHEVWGARGWRQYLGRLAPFGAVIERLAARLPDGIVSVSDHTSQRLVWDLATRKPVYTIALGVDMAEIGRVSAGTRVDVLYAGRLLAHKHVDLLLEAVALLAGKRHDLLCHIVGEGPERRRLEEQRDTLLLHNHVVFRDFTPHDEIYGLMKGARVLALPSTREGFGCIVVEAYACGVPVVTLDHPDNAARHLVAEGETGFLAGLDAADLARALDTALTMAPIMDVRGAVGRTGLLREWTEVTAEVHAVLAGAAAGVPIRPAARPVPAQPRAEQRY
ncbi:MAG TPA: glycosyltransferase family 4 protein [Rugosimonospora sp.]|nr:glycosyltransferase family 4 protein [Rugosimonospora sp.]